GRAVREQDFGRGEVAGEGGPVELRFAHATGDADVETARQHRLECVRAGFEKLFLVHRDELRVAQAQRLGAVTAHAGGNELLVGLEFVRHTAGAERGGGGRAA